MRYKRPYLVRILIFSSSKITHHRNDLSVVETDRMAVDFVVGRLKPNFLVGDFGSENHDKQRTKSDEYHVHEEVAMIVMPDAIVQPRWMLELRKIEFLKIRQAFSYTVVNFRAKNDRFQISQKDTAMMVHFQNAGAANRAMVSARRFWNDTFSADAHRFFDYHTLKKFLKNIHFSSTIT